MKSVSASVFRCRGINTVRTRKRENEKARCLGPKEYLTQGRKESLFKIGSCKKKVQSKSEARCPAYGGLVCTVSVALNLNMSL